MTELFELDSVEARHELFRRGRVSWMLKPEQKEIYDQILACSVQKFVINSSRRLGKSFLLCVLADEYARNNPACSIKYAAPTQKQVREIVKPIFIKLLLDCPDDCKPVWNALDSCYTYSNGAKISIAGCDLGKVDRLRGTEANLCLIDEAGMIDERLDYIIKDILLPQTLTVKKVTNLDGKIIMASTPPTSPAHDFVRYITEAEGSKDKNYVKKTIFDNSAISLDTILTYAVESGCIVENGKIIKYSTTFRREYLAQVITEESLAICPEFNEDTERDIVYEVTRPSHFDAYISMDVGLIDLTAQLYAYWDFANAKLVIEDEWAANYKDGLNTDVIASAVKRKEAELYGQRGAYLRIMDNNLIMCQDLRDLHGLAFMPTEKDDKDAAVNKMRLWIHNKKIAINPRCNMLRSHLKYGIWNKQKTKFERSGEYGHFDMVDALVYLVRNINEQKNPYPDQWGLINIGTHHKPPRQESLTSQEAVWKNIFGLNKKRPQDETMSALEMLSRRRFK